MTRISLLLIAALAAGCAARLPPRPSGPATPDPQAASLFEAATKRCAGLRTLTASLRLSGRAGDERLRGTLHAGLAAPASLRVEAIAPFGQPVFILAGRNNQATLLLVRDDRVLPDAPLSAVLERLTGLSLSAEALRLMLTGCLGHASPPADGRAFGRDWRAVSLGDEGTAFLRPVAGTPAVVAADYSSWRVDYAGHLNEWPRQVRIRSTTGEVDLTAQLDELEINTGIDEKAFEVAVPASATRMSLDQLRAVTPLRATP